MNPHRPDKDQLTADLMRAKKQVRLFTVHVRKLEHELREQSEEEDNDQTLLTVDETAMLARIADRLRSILVASRALGELHG